MMLFDLLWRACDETGLPGCTVMRYLCGLNVSDKVRETLDEFTERVESELQ